MHMLEELNSRILCKMFCTEGRCDLADFQLFINPPDADKFSNRNGIHIWVMLT